MNLSTRADPNREGEATEKQRLTKQTQLWRFFSTNLLRGTQLNQPAAARQQNGHYAKVRYRTTQVVV
jgi:hypothetical protein